MCTLIELLAQSMKTIEFFSKSNSARFLHPAFVGINHFLKWANSSRLKSVTLSNVCLKFLNYFLYLFDLTVLPIVKNPYVIVDITADERM